MTMTKGSQETRSAIDVRHFVSEYRAKSLFSDPGTWLTTARLQYQQSEKQGQWTILCLERKLGST